MPHLVIAGFNTWHIRALLKGGIIGCRPGWTFELVPSGQKPIGFTKTAPVLEEASRDAFSHVLAVSQQDGNIRQRLAREIRPFFRFRWLDGIQLTQLLADDFVSIGALLNPILEQEEEWAKIVKPAAVSDALVLPSDIFSCDHDVNIWGLSEAYGDPLSNENAARAVKRFSERYFAIIPPEGHFSRRTQWLCREGRIYDHRGPRHGEPPFPRGWKYSWCVDTGFHFDVSSRDGRPFVAQGFEDGRMTQRTVSAGKHVNIDTHGFFR